MHTTRWELLWRLGLALVLSTVIGLEREYRQKSAGLRTYTLVGLGSALFLLVSEFGFFDELERGRVVLDPSRVAAVGMAAGAGLPVPAVASTLAYLLVTMTYPLIAGRLLGTALAPAPLRITYLDGQGVLRDVLSRVTNAGFAASDLNFQRHDEDAVVVDVRVTGRGALTGLVGELGALDGVLVVHTAETDPD
jgi:putative Mg2+ transporter-C (MgtC) family protein